MSFMKICNTFVTPDVVIYYMSRKTRAIKHMSMGELKHFLKLFQQRPCPKTTLPFRL